MDKRKIIQGILSFIVSMIIMFILLVIFSVLAFGIPGCKPLPEPVEPTEIGYTCSTACEQLFKLGCDGFDGSYGPDLEPATGDEVDCMNVCLDLVENFNLPVACISVIFDCEGVDACFE